MKFTMTKIAAAAVLAATSFASVNAHAVAIDSGVFNMYSGLGFDTAGVITGSSTPINVDTTIAGFINATTWGVSSTTPFFGFNWTASNGQLITAAGSYSMDTASGITSAVGSCGAAASNGAMCFNVGAGQLAGTIDFAYNVTTGIRVINVWNVTTDGISNFYTAAAIPGMENGPFQGFNAAFNMAAPVPEASTYGMMLAGLGLVGFAVRRRKMMAA